MCYVGSDGVPTRYALGAAGYTLNGRWGDYAAISADPSDSSAIWMLGQYAKASNAWGMAVRPAGAVSSVVATATPTPTPTTTARPTATTTGSATATPSATATGTTSTSGVTVSQVSANSAQRGQQVTVAVSGSGFQSGATPSFGDRVTVQSVTFVNSGSLQVRLRAQTRATPGPRDVTITNPDGSSGKLPSGFTVSP